MMTDIQPENSETSAIIRTITDLSALTSELSSDIEKLDTYISAIERIIEGKYTPFDEAQCNSS